jgi:hypothetical protein
MMKKDDRFRAIAWISTAGLVLLVALGLFFWSRLPDISQLIPPGSTRLIVNLTSPANGDRLDPTTMTTVQADALGARPVVSMQFWVDGAIQGSKQSAGTGRQQVSAFWAWTPSAAGEHILMVGATDDQGRQAYSDPIIVFGVSSSGDTKTYLSLPGDTLDGIAGRLNRTPVELALSNPGLDPISVLPSDSPVKIPLPGAAGPVTFPPVPIPPSGGSPAGAGPGKLLVWWSLLTGGGHVPPIPALSAAASGCDVSLAITLPAGGAEGLFLYRLDGSAVSFKRIATMAPGKPGTPVVYTDAGVYGPLLYYAAAFNGAGESDGNLAGATIASPACKPAVPPGYELKKLTITPSGPLDSMYCYFSLAAGQWSRIPSGDGTFVYPFDGTFDFTPYLGLLPSADITPQTQCWGWRGGTLVELGLASGPAPAPDGSFALRAADYAISGLLEGMDPFGGSMTVMDGDPLTGPIMPPFNLARTSNLETCEGHFPGGASGFLGPLFCAPSITHNNLILTWDWVPTCIFPSEGSKYKCSDYVTAIDGFHIYAALPGKTPVLVATVHDKDQHVYIFDGGRFPPGTRFIVRAFVGARESPDSNPYTLADTTPGTESVTLLPVVLHTRDDQADDEDCSVGSAPGLGSAATWTDGVNVVVGEDYQYPGSGCVNWNDHRFTGRVSFDLSPVAGPVASATLTFKQGYSIANQYLFPVTCLDQLGLITTLSGDDPAAWDPYRKLPFSGTSGTAHSVDATDLVREWQLGTSNLGFVLTPHIDATGGDPYTQECWSTLGNFQLNVTYFK